MPLLHQIPSQRQKLRDLKRKALGQNFHTPPSIHAHHCLQINTNTSACRVSRHIAAILYRPSFFNKYVLAETVKRLHLMMSQKC